MPEIQDARYKMEPAVYFFKPVFLISFLQTYIPHGDPLYVMCNSHYVLRDHGAFNHEQSSLMTFCVQERD